MKRCSNCGTEEQAAFAPTQKYKCRPCTNEYSMTNYRANKARVISQSITRNTARKMDNRQRMVEYLKSRTCADCPESDPVVMEFDHLGNKTECVSNMVASSYKWDTILKEIQKCDLVCANCHRRRTASRHGGWYRSFGV